MDSVFQNIQLSCQLSRPRRPIQFITRYLCEEKLSFNFPTNNSSNNNPNQPTTTASPLPSSSLPLTTTPTTLLPPSSSSTTTAFNLTPQILQQIIEEYHAIHLLPFLITQKEEFRNTACIIFCAEQIHGHFSKDYHQFVVLGGGSSGSGGGSGSSSSGGGGLREEATSLGGNSVNYREYLDGTTVIDILQAMDFPSYGLQNNFIDDMIIEKLEPLKRIDFNLFISAIRFPIITYQALIWLKDEIYSFLKNLEISSSSSLFPLKDDISIELGKLKSYLNKKFSSGKGNLATSSFSSSGIQQAATGAINPVITAVVNVQVIKDTHNYHLFPMSYEDMKHWSKILQICIEEEKNLQVLTVQQLNDKFLRRLVITNQLYS